MKAMYTNEVRVPEFNIDQAYTYNYESRKQASNNNFKFVHLFTSKINYSENVEYTHYSTMKM